MLLKVAVPLNVAVLLCITDPLNVAVLAITKFVAVTLPLICNVLTPLSVVVLINIFPLFWIR